MLLFKNEYLKVYKKLHNGMEERIYEIDSITSKCYKKVFTSYI